MTLPTKDTADYFTDGELIRMEEKLCLNARTKVEALGYDFTPIQLDDIEGALLEAVREKRAE